MATKKHKTKVVFAEKEFLKDFKAALAALREEGVRQTHAALEMGVDDAALSKILSGKCGISIDNFGPMARYVGLDINSYFREKRK